MMEFLNNSVPFALSLCLIAYFIGLILYKSSKDKWYNFLFSPLIVALALVLMFIRFTGLDPDKIYSNVYIINFFLGPVVVMMGYIIYENLNRIKENLIPILSGIIVGSFVGVISIMAFSNLLGLNSEIVKSLLAKSITAPMAIEVTKQIGGDQGIVLIGVILAGNLGAMFGPILFKILGIKSKIAQGIALGTGSHAVGTSKAFELGETEGAMSSLSIALCGICTVIWIPIILFIFTL